MKKAIKKVNNWIKNNDPNEWLELHSLGLEKLPNIPSNCRYLDCCGNHLTSLPELPSCEILVCYFNQLNSLPQLVCRVIHCQFNNLTSLPQLDNCTELYCWCNELTYLPKLPNCISLKCDMNKLTSLPQLPKCSELYCGNNQITYLPPLPSCYQLDYAHNKYLYISKHIAKKFHKEETHNYNRSAQLIQKNYKRYLRKKYQYIINSFLFTGPTKIVCLYL